MRLVAPGHAVYAFGAREQPVDLDALGQRPGTWGDPEATELQYLAALETAYVLARPGEDLREVRDLYAAWRAGVGLAGPLTLAADLARRGRGDELLPLLARFRARLEARLATETPAIVRGTCTNCGMALPHPYTDASGYGCPATTAPRTP